MEASLSPGNALVDLTGQREVSACPATGGVHTLQAHHTVSRPDVGADNGGDREADDPGRLSPQALGMFRTAQGRHHSLYQRMDQDSTLHTQSAPTSPARSEGQAPWFPKVNSTGDGSPNRSLAETLPSTRLESDAEYGLLRSRDIHRLDQSAGQGRPVPIQRPPSPAQQSAWATSFNKSGHRSGVQAVPRRPSLGVVYGGFQHAHRELLLAAKREALTLAQAQKKLLEDQEAVGKKEESHLLNSEALVQPQKQNLLFPAEPTSQREALEKLTERQRQGEGERPAAQDVALRLAGMVGRLQESSLAQAPARRKYVPAHQAMQQCGDGSGGELCLDVQDVGQLKVLTNGTGAARLVCHRCSLELSLGDVHTALTVRIKEEGSAGGRLVEGTMTCVGGASLQGCELLFECHSVVTAPGVTVAEAAAGQWVWVAANKPAAQALDIKLRSMHTPNRS